MRLLVTADVHVEAWSMYDLTPGFRLQQYEKLGDWLLTVIDEYGVDAVLIGGDYFHKPVNPPKVILTGVKLAKKLSSAVPVVLIHGQHDLDTRDRVSAGRSNSLVSLLNEVGSDNMHYLHNSSVILNGVKIFGYGWEPVFSPNLDEARGARVVLLHGQVRGSSSKSVRFEDGIDPEPLFPEAYFIFVGDVHNHQILGGGKIVVPGPPIYHTFNDGSAGVVVADLGTKEVEFIPSGYVKDKRVFSFLQLVSESSSSQTGIKEEVDKDSLLVRRIKGKAPDKASIQNQISSRSPLEVIRSVAESEGLLTAYEFAVSRVSRSVATPYDHPQSWTPIYLEIENFRSIESLHLDFSRLGKLIFLTGANGSGKSSLLSAIKFVLTGEGDKSLVMSGAKEMMVRLALEYLGQEVVIERGYRGSQYLTVFVDGVPLEAPSLREKQARLEEKLPFIKTFNELYYFDQFRPGLVSSLTPKQRVDLVSQIFGLSVIGDIEEVVKEEVSRLKGEVSGLAGELSSIESSLASLRELQREMVSVQVSQSELEEYEFLKGVVEEMQEEIAAIEQRSREYGSRMSLTESAMRQLEAKLRTTQETKKCYVCGSLLTDTKLAEVSMSLRGEIEEYEKELKALNAEYITLLEKREGALRSLNRVIGRYQELDGIIKKYEGLKVHYESLMKTLKDTEDRLEEVSVLIKEKSLWLEDLERFRRILTTRAYATILENISKSLSYGPVRVSTIQEFKNGSVKPTVELYFKISEEHELPFELLSGGQRTLADTLFLFRLLSTLDGVGVLVFDETFRFLDSSSYEAVFEMLQSSNASYVFYVSHDISPALRFDTQISVSRVGLKSIYHIDS